DGRIVAELTLGARVGQDHMRDRELPTIPSQERSLAAPCALPACSRQALIKDPFAGPGRLIIAEHLAGEKILIGTDAEEFPTCAVEIVQPAFWIHATDDIGRRLDDGRQLRLLCLGLLFQLLAQLIE